MTRCFLNFIQIFWIFFKWQNLNEQGKWGIHIKIMCFDQNCVSSLLLLLVWAADFSQNGWANRTGTYPSVQWKSHCACQPWSCDAGLWQYFFDWGWLAAQYLLNQLIKYFLWVVLWIADHREGIYKSTYELGEPCPKVRLSQDRLPIEPFACMKRLVS